MYFDKVRLYHTSDFMKIYFDESGQSGCILQKNDMLNFKKQPTFAICAVVVHDNQDENNLVKKYIAFKNKFKIEDEIKGSNLLTRKYNHALNVFLQDITDNNHFFVILYDKRFYISTLLLLSLLGYEYQYEMPDHFYQQASILSLQNDDFFVEYLKYIQDINEKNFEVYLKYLINYDYKYCENIDNAVIDVAKEILSHRLVDCCYDDFMTFGWYDNPNITNLINLTALSELIYLIKEQTKSENTDIIFIHDHIREYEQTFIEELSKYDINVLFQDSKENNLLQVADNMVSVVRHAYDKCILHHSNKEQWDENNEWNMELVSKVFRKISLPHIKFTVPLHDWVATIATMEMFSSTFSKSQRNNLTFNYYYQIYYDYVYNMILNNKKPLEKIIDELKK